MTIVCARETCRRVTVLTLEQTGIVRADVFADHTAARGALGRILDACHFNAKRFVNVIRIHTFARRDSVRLQIHLLGATLDRHSIFVRRARERAQTFGKLFAAIKLCAERLQPGRAQRLQPSPTCRVLVRDADDDAIGVTAQRARDPRERFDVPARVCRCREDDRIVPPDRFGGTDPRGKVLEIPNRLRERGRLRIERARIVQQRHLEIIAIAALVEFVQALHHRARLARPEDEQIHILRQQRDARDLFRVERIRHRAIPRAHAIDEPTRVERGNIGATTDADDQMSCSKNIGAKISLTPICQIAYLFFVTCVTTAPTSTYTILTPTIANLKIAHHCANTAFASCPKPSKI